MNAALPGADKSTPALDAIAEALFCRGHRRRLRTHRAVRGRGRGARRADLAPSRTRHRSAALSAGDEPAAAGEIRLPEELSATCSAASAACTAPNARSTRRSSASMPAATGRRRCRRPISCSVAAACYPVYPIVASRGRVPRAACSSTSPADCFRARAVEAISTGCNRSGCANMSASAAPSTIADFRERWMARAQAICADLLGLTFTRRTTPAIRSSAGSAR